jgi:hypothetical protein
MSAIITDQIRILNSKSFIDSIKTGKSNLYTFVGLPNASEYSSDWDSNPPSPKDSLDDENDYWDSMISLKKINPSSDVRNVIRKVVWDSGSSYDMYRHNITRNNLSNPSQKTSLYQSNYYILTKDYRVYICLNNGGDKTNNFEALPSLIEPNFIDLEPKTLEDGYTWKYLYTLKVEDVIKFDSLNFIPVPSDWETAAEYQSIRLNAQTSGQIKIATVTNVGENLGRSKVYSNINIVGDGSGGQVSIVVGNEQRVTSIFVTRGGSGYTYGTVDLSSVSFPANATLPQFDVIIPPKGGHGFDIYKELGAYNVLVYSRFENDITNPDFITGNQIARIGIVNNPLEFDSNIILNRDRASATYALKLVGTTNRNDYVSANILPDSIFTQTIGVGVTAVGRVISYDNRTGILKYWQDRSLYGFNLNGEYTENQERKAPNTTTYGYNKIKFSSIVSTGGSININGLPISLKIDTAFTGITTVINNVTYNLGQRFTSGTSNPEVKPKSGDIIYVDNRPSITRSPEQREDVKVILQF